MLKEIILEDKSKDKMQAINERIRTQEQLSYTIRDDKFQILMKMISENGHMRNNL